MERCRQRMTNSIVKSGFQYGGMLGSNYLALSFLFIAAVLIIYNQRIHYPQHLFDKGSTEELSTSVDVCFNTLISLNETCQTLCNEIEQCWYHDGNKCLV